MRESIAFGILIFIMIFLFAFVFAVLGRGEYEPGGSVEPVEPPPVISQTLA